MSVNSNFTIAEESPLFVYSPLRDADPTQVRPDIIQPSKSQLGDNIYGQGWNSSYSGETSYSPKQRSGGDGGGPGVGVPYRRTQLDGASLNFSFEGTALYLCLTAPEGSSYNFSVDQQIVDKVGDASTDGACKSYNAQTLAVADGLAYGNHSATLAVSITDVDIEFQFFGGVVTVSAGDYGPAISAPSYVHNTDPGWTWEPSANWGAHSWTGSVISKSIRWTCAYEANVTATYSVPLGTAALQLLGPVVPNAWAYSVSLGRTSSTYNATNFWTSNDQVMFFAGGLDPTTSYTLVIANFDPEATGLPATEFYDGGCLYIDAIMLLKSLSGTSTTVSLPSSPVSSLSGFSSSSLPTRSSGSSSTGTTSSTSPVNRGAIAGGVVGGIVVLVLICVAVFVVLRRRQQYVLPRLIVEDDQESFSKSPRKPISFPPVPPGAPPSFVDPTQCPRTSSAGGRSVVGRPAGAPSSALSSDPLPGVSTMDLVQALNERLRAEQVGNVEAPPGYTVQLPDIQ